MRDFDFLLGWAAPGSAAHYDPAKLRPEDRVRAGQARAPRADLDWRASRALIASLPPGGPVGSLSHSGGHALCVLVAPGMPGARVGVDLERIRPRRVADLGRWVCDGAEQRTLARLGEGSRGQLEYFYMLWTLKEALVKAAGLDFPGAMQRIGLDGEPGSASRLRAPAGAWGAMVLSLGPDWIAALAWESGGAAAAPRLAWHAGPAAALPPCRLLGQWQGAGSPLL
ncbi:4'-phosphopantetheinyl transferase superfamily protein [Bordetella sp. FB-8]|uniref:4'-phosphopantetheinyl transferase family protein n=1 Tax=Bordetella sp. FB-8 TaxID=1159870 RepID=UPI00036C7B39|nr:4'-phosphopantetheinyl transferase superfamily protein [Bordetella sp. FB-8]